VPISKPKPFVSSVSIVHDHSAWLFARGRAMPTHKFKIGETVFLEPSRDQNLPGGAYIVIKKLPEHDGEFEYRVRSSYEPHERVVRESQLSAAP
jgi:hypothetical protein